MKLNISIDDVSPHPLASIDVVDSCLELLDEFDDLKFTLFVPAAYWRTIPSPPQSSSTAPFFVSQHQLFCDKLRSLPDESFEIGYHGYFHGIPGRSNNDEFKDLTLVEAREVFVKIDHEIRRANLIDKFKPIFRPPAWRMSPGAFEAAKEAGIKILGLSSLDYAKQTYQKSDESEFWKGKVVYCNVNPPIMPLTLFDKTEIMYHSCQWDRSFLGGENLVDLKKFLTATRELYDPVFIEGLI